MKNLKVRIIKKLILSLPERDLNNLMKKQLLKKKREHLAAAYKLVGEGRKTNDLRKQKYLAAVSYADAALNLSVENAGEALNRARAKRKGILK